MSPGYLFFSWHLADNPQERHVRESKSVLAYLMLFSLKVHFLPLLYKTHKQLQFIVWVLCVCVGFVVGGGFLVFFFLFFLLTCWQSNEPALTRISKVCKHSFQQAKDSFMTTCYSYPIVPLSALSVDASFFTLDVHCWWAVLSSALGHLS